MVLDDGGLMEYDAPQRLMEDPGSRFFQMVSRFTRPEWLYKIPSCPTVTRSPPAQPFSLPRALP
jgi:hypothetical protein